MSYKLVLSPDKDDTRPPECGGRKKLHLEDDETGQVLDAVVVKVESDIMTVVAHIGITDIEVRNG